MLNYLHMSVSASDISRNMNLKMAATDSVDISKLSDVFPLTWSVDTKHDVFQRWSQGFFFSEDEPTALVQNNGGPCSVIASVQAYLARQLIFKKFKKTESDDWRRINDNDRRQLLCKTLIDIWELVATENFQVVLMRNHYINEGSENERLETVQTIGESSTQGEDTCVCTCKDYHKNICSQTESQTQDVFHSALRQFSCRKSEHLEDFIIRNIHQFEGTFGVLLFLYSILLSKGIENIKTEMDETLANPLIDPVHGHGGQSLVNLMLTGYAVSHVWDLERDIGGLKLKGIPKQSNIGFLSLLESMRYCEVGSFLKCPKDPIWLLASETHLTVLFTKENVDHKRPVDNAIRIFKTFDTQENGFIERSKLKDVLEALELESDPDYVSFMESCLDQDSSGIILLHSFLQMFYPEENEGISEQSDFARSFPVYHYNGLAKCSGKEDNRKKVVYSEGVCTLLSGDVICLSDGQFLNCLRTKWPYIIIDWKTEPKPSLN